jgi:hypothetical protein
LAIGGWFRVELWFRSTLGYDETGEVDEPPVDQHRVQLLDMLAAGLDLAMLKLDKQSQFPKTATWCS